MSMQWQSYARTAVGIPYLCGIVVTSGYQSVPVNTELDIIDTILMMQNFADGFDPFSVPDPCCVVETRSQQLSSVRAELRIKNLG